MKTLLKISYFSFIFLLLLFTIVYLCNGDITRIKEFMYWNVTISGVLWIINFFNPKSNK
jgi:hypothetical protein